MPEQQADGDVGDGPDGTDDNGSADVASRDWLFERCSPGILLEGFLGSVLVFAGLMHCDVLKDCLYVGCLLATSVKLKRDDARCAPTLERSNLSSLGDSS